MPPRNGDAALAEALSRYRDGLLRGASPAELEELAHGLDPQLVATEVWSLNTGRQARRQPDPRFLADLRQTILQESAAMSQEPSSPLPTLPVLRRGLGTTLRPVLAQPTSEKPPRAIGSRPRWTWTFLAAAAVLALIVVSAVLLGRLTAVEQPTTQLDALGAPATEVLLDATITNPAPTRSPLTVERWRFQPEATLTIPALDGPQWIVADASPFVATVDGEEQMLAPGTSLVVPAGQTLSVRNPGPGEAAALRGVAAASFSLEEYDRGLVTVETALDTEAHESLPPGQSHIVFDRLSIPPGTTMKAEAATGRDWFTVVTGQLGLTLIGDALPGGWESGRERELAAGESMPTLVPGTSVSMHNVGDDPLVLLRLRVSPAEAEAPPPGA